jgi:hypothetical protein
VFVTGQPRLSLDLCVSQFSSGSRMRLGGDSAAYRMERLTCAHEGRGGGWGEGGGGERKRGNEGRGGGGGGDVGNRRLWNDEMCVSIELRGQVHCD